MGKKSKNPVNQGPRAEVRADPVDDKGSGLVKDGRALKDYRFSATNMMLGLDSMVLKNRTKKAMAIQTKKGQQRVEASTQTADRAGKNEPNTQDDESDEVNAAGPKTKDQNQSNSPSEALSESQLSSEEAAELNRTANDSSENAEESTNESGEGAVIAESSKTASEADASTEGDNTTSEAALEAEAASTKSVSFAEGTSSPAPSPPATSCQPVKLCSTSGVDDWSMSEDAMILNMKEQGASWDLIASSIRRTKAQVRKRYYELKCDHANAATSAEDATVPDADAVREPRPVHAEYMMPSLLYPFAPAMPGPFYENGYTFLADSEDYEVGDDEDEESDESSSQDSIDEFEDDQASSANDLLDLLREDSSAASSSVTDEADGYDASDYDPFADPADPVAYERERRRQERYIRHHAHASMYSPARKGEAGNRRDQFVSQGFSRRDRALLAGLDDRRVATQWLEMQANFFNVTGRMVPLHLIKAKLENRSPSDADIGYLARGERKVLHWTEAVANGDDLLDPALAKEMPQDALHDGSDEEEDGGKSSVSD